MFVGGTDVIVRLRHGAMKPAALIDLKRVQELSDRLEQHGDSIRIGARVTMTTILGDERIRRWFPALLEAAAVVGSIQIRNRATLVGNVCNASPAADTVPVLLVHGAVANIAGPAGERRVPLAEFFVGPGRTVLERGELVVSLDLPIPSGPVGAAFGRLTRRRGVDLAVINLCVLLEAGRPARMAFGAVAPTPILSVDATGALDGSTEWTDASERALASMLTSTTADLRRARRARLPGGDAARAGQARMADRPPAPVRTRDPRIRDQRTREPRTREPRTREPATPCVSTRTTIPSRRPRTRRCSTCFATSLRLTGTKECCAEGECGACTVLVDGEAVCSCLVMAAEMPGHEITTIEGLASGGRLDPLQAAFVESGAVQCGFCIPGMIMSARALLDLNPRPTREEVQDALSGNLCRCGGYSRIVDAVARVISSGVER